MIAYRTNRKMRPASIEVVQVEFIDDEIVKLKKGWGMDRRPRIQPLSQYHSTWAAARDYLLEGANAAISEHNEKEMRLWDRVSVISKLKEPK